VKLDILVLFMYVNNPNEMNTESLIFMLEWRMDGDNDATFIHILHVGASLNMAAGFVNGGDLITCDAPFCMTGYVRPTHVSFH